MNTLIRKTFAGCNWDELNDIEFMREYNNPIKKKIRAQAFMIKHFTIIPGGRRGGKTYKLATQEELPEHLRIWLDADWNKFKKIGEMPSTLTRARLKEIRASYKTDHQYDAIRYGLYMAEQPKAPASSFWTKLSDRLHVRGMIKSMLRIIKFQKPKYRMKK